MIQTADTLKKAKSVCRLFSRYLGLGVGPPQINSAKPKSFRCALFYGCRGYGAVGVQQAPFVVRLPGGMEVSSYPG